MLVIFYVGKRVNDEERRDHSLFKWDSPEHVKVRFCRTGNLTARSIFGFAIGSAILKNKIIKLHFVHQSAYPIHRDLVNLVNSTLANFTESPWLDHGAHRAVDLIYQSLLK